MKSLNKYFNTKNKRIVFSVLCLFMIIVLVLIYCLFLKITGIGIPCIFHKITNLYCPGCGMTRAFLALLQFDFVKAIQYNALVFIILPFIIFYILYVNINWINGKMKKDLPKALVITLLIIFLAFAILRNIPGLDFLRPLIN